MFDAFEIVLLLLLGDSMDLFWCLSFLDCVVLVKVMTVIHFLHIQLKKKKKNYVIDI